ncbi:MAG: DNA repair protein RecN [Crocinitomicaceae bacterium]|nr:DNA repair protein RecN [Crocinitomicaceae bacterium]
MIASLRIENFALIDEVHIQFTKGFTVITGETGSGKSILLNALNLILGERANFSVIGDRKDKSIVEAQIQIADFDLNTFFEQEELDYFDNCIIRREISKQGRSRAFINDTPVQLATLKELSSRLIHIHSQYNTLELKDVNYQLNILDSLAGNSNVAKQFKADFRAFSQEKKELKALQAQLAELASTADYNQFQLNELLELNLDSVDFEKIQSDLKAAENSGDLKACYAELSEGLNSDDGAIDRLERMKNFVAKYTSMDETLSSLNQRIESSLIELKDIALEAEGRLEDMDIDPEKIDELSERMNSFNRVLYKHNVQTQEELVALRNELDSSAVNSGELEVEVEKRKENLSKTESELTKRAADLHEKRIKAAPQIEKQLKEALNELKLVDTALNFNVTKSADVNETGASKIEMLFSPNKGIEPVPIHRAASGGELSRVMLALQSLMAAKTKLQTVLFDEIDTGVSGDVAQKVGNTLEKMGKGMQVIAITHLPQVAAKGEQHFRVSKAVVDGKTKSSVIELSAEERVEETARLMSGDVINEAALENARALMS